MTTKVTEISKPGIAKMLLMTVLLTGGLHANADPDKFVVGFQGEVVKITCAVSWPSSPVVDFGDISRANFTGVNSVGKTKTFSVRLSDCSGVRNTSTMQAGIYFSGPGCAGQNTGNPVSVRSHPLMNPKAEGNSTGIGIQLYHEPNGNLGNVNEHKIQCNQEPGAIVPLTTGSTQTVSVGNSDEEVYTIRAEVIQTGVQPPTIGKLNATGTLTMYYY